MDNKLPLDPKTGDGNKDEARERTPGLFARWTNLLLSMGLGESMLRASTNILSVIAIVIVIWLVQAFYRQGAFITEASAAPTPTAVVAVNAVPVPADSSSTGITRLAQIHTVIPSRPRSEITPYTVQAGDTVSGIAERYGLQPITIFAANFDVLQDDPHSLRPGQVLRILPVDGVYWEWQGGIPFGQWAEYFKVKPEDIINYAPNKIDAASVGTDFANANIKTGTFLIVPSGVYQYHTPGGMPLGLTRDSPASAQVAGPGSCPAITGGAIGYGTFVFPTDKHVLSGFDYSTKTNHLGIDLMGNEGANVYASDGGVVVYAGWNNYGYGNMIMIDHGTGFQSLYGHLSQVFVNCGDNVTQSQVVGAVGTTGNSSGPHLHFEVRTPSVVINPWDVLPNP
jgi:murein DD-endopeptidase MepM/ murein hydrolase activator NlpD